MKQLAADCALMEELRVMDYSLLLGVHYRSPGYASSPQVTDKVDHAASRHTEHYAWAHQSQMSLLLAPQLLVHFRMLNDVSSRLTCLQQRLMLMDVDRIWTDITSQLTPPCFPEATLCSLLCFVLVSSTWPT